MELREIIRKAREKKGFRQVDLSVITGVSQGTISNIEGYVNYMPKFHYVCLILEALNLDINETWKKTKKDSFVREYPERDNKAEIYFFPKREVTG